MTALADYFAALERLKSRKPTRVPAGTKITNDAVALEAGRVKGSIKKSRPMFTDLITAIDEAAMAQAAPVERERQRLERVRESEAEYRRSLEASLAREVSLLREIYSLRKELSRLTGAKVVPIRGT